MKTFMNSLIRNRDLLEVYCRRDIMSKYKGSRGGVLWAVLTPIMMLIIYTIVFSQIFQTRWGGDELEGISKINFALNLFTGLCVYNIFAECAAKGPTLITSNPNYIKKVIFPIEILGATTTISATFNGTVGILIAITGWAIANHEICETIIYLPIILGSYAMLMLGITWMLSIIGVLIKDTSQVIGSIISVMLFMSPVFYPSSAVPEGLRWLVSINPIAYYIEQIRNILIRGVTPNISHLMIISAFLWLFCEVSYKKLKGMQSQMSDLI